MGFLLNILTVLVGTALGVMLGNRLPDSLETSLGLSEGLVRVELADEKKDKKKESSFLMSSKFACPVSGFTLSEIEPRLFSFNSPYGACPTCDGLGSQMFFDPDLVVPDPDLTLAEGAVAPAFRDIYLGANAVTPVHPGYDMITGLSSPNIANLVKDLLVARSVGR